MSVFVCGDTHGTFDIHKLSSKEFPEGKNLTKDDFLIILGDSGINWSNNDIDRNDLYLKKWLNDKPWTTIDILGNHHNYDRLFTQTPVDFMGGEAFHISESIFALKRGTVITIEDRKIFSMGGGFSIDKNQRKEFISWWRQEMPSFSELSFASKQLEQHNFEVDFIVSHTCSQIVFKKITKKFDFNEKKKGEESLRDFFDWVEDNVSFNEWHFGHFHIDYEIDDKHFCHYNAKPKRII